MYDVAVTHSPRYLIDMEVNKGESFFNKIDIPYDALRSQDNPIASIVEYFRKTAKAGEQPWWINSPEEISPATIRLLENLSTTDKNNLKIEAFARFPEIFSNHPDKYKRLATWLVARHSLTSTCLRDQFSAGGKISLTINDKQYSSIPRVYKHLHDNFTPIIEEVMSLDPQETLNFLQINSIYQSKASTLKTWTNKVIEYATASSPQCAEFIYHLFWSRLNSKAIPDVVKEAQSSYGF